MTQLRSRARVRIMLAAAVGLVAAAVFPSGTAPRAVAAAAAHPRLLFSQTDVPAMQSKVTSGVASQAWHVVLTEAKELSDPTSPLYVNPANVSNPNDYNGQNQMPAYLEDMAFASVISGDPTYGQHAIDVMKALGAAGWPAWNGNALGKGDLLRGVGLAFDWTYTIMSAADRSTIVNSMTQHEQYLFGITTEGGAPASPGSNWMGVSSGGAGLALLALDGEAGAPADLSTQLNNASSRINTYFGSFDPGGAWGEGWLYGNYGMRNALPFALAYNRAGYGDLIGANPRIKSMRNWGSYELIPGDRYGMIPLNDSPTDTGDDELPELFFALNPGDPQDGWFWTQTVGPNGVDEYNPARNQYYAGAKNCVYPTTNPASAALCLESNAPVYNIIYNTVDSSTSATPDGVLPYSTWFQQRGLVDARTGWSHGGNDFASTFEAHRGPAGHWQEDAGQFTLYGMGTAWAVDSGYGHNYSCTSVTVIVEGGGSCPYTDQGTADGHNVILVDGSALTQQSMNGATTLQTMTTQLTGPDFAYALADTRYQFGEPLTAPYAWRHWMLDTAPGRPVLLAVSDSMQKDSAQHTWVWQMHTDAANAVGVAGPNFTITGPTGATMTGLNEVGGNPMVNATPPLGLSASYPLPGGRPFAMTVLKEEAFFQSLAVDHLSVMAVVAPGQLPATLSTLQVGGGNAVDVSWNNVHDVVGAAVHGSTRTSGANLDTDGAFFKFTQGMCETVLRQGTKLSGYGQDYVVVTGGASDVTCGGGAISATGTAGNTYKVYSPSDPSSVTVNGTAVTWTRSGSYVTFS